MGKKFGGMPGGMGGGNMMRQLQKMQEDMLKAQEETEAKEFTANAGGGAVTATVTGARRLVGISISAEAVDPDDVDMLQDLVLAAVNSALEEAESAMSAVMQKFTGGISMPGLF